MPQPQHVRVESLMVRADSEADRPGAVRLREAVFRAQDALGLDVDEALELAAEALIARLEGAGRDDTLMARELRHRMDNQMQFVLSALRLRSRRAASRGEIAECASCVGQVGAAVELNRVIDGGGSVASIDMARILRSVCRLFEGTLPSERIRIETRLEPVHVPRDVAEALVLAVNEAMTNAVKHAFPDDGAGTVRVVLRRMGERAVVAEVSDDGVGLDPEAPPLGKGRDVVARILAGRGGIVRRVGAGKGCALAFELPLPVEM